MSSTVSVPNDILAIESQQGTFDVSSSLFEDSCTFVTGCVAHSAMLCLLVPTGRARLGPTMRSLGDG